MSEDPKDESRDVGSSETAVPPTSPAPTFPDPWIYLAIVCGLYVLLGSVAQSHQLPLGLWLSQAGFFFLPSVILLWARGFRPWRFLGLSRLPPLGQQPLVLIISFFTFLAASSLMAVLEILAPSDVVERFDVSRVLGSVSGSWQMVLFASVIVGAPIAEETVFRGVLFPFLRQRTGLRRALFLQAALFSVIHIDPVGFAPRFLLGVVLGELSLFTGSLWASIFAHALNNGVSTIFFFSFGEGPKSQVGTSDLIVAATVAAGSSVLAFAFMALLRQRAVSDRLPQENPENFRPPPTPQRAKAVAWGWLAVCLLSLWGLHVMPGQ